MNTVERAILRKVQNHKYFFKVNETLRVSKFSDITLIYMPVNAQVFRKFLALQYVHKIPDLRIRRTPFASNLDYLKEADER